MSIAGAWAQQGSKVELAGHQVFVVDRPPSGEEQAPPLLVLHGFPSSSLDYHRCLDRLAEHRRVLLFDFLGFGLSAKPDQHYELTEQADVAVAVAAEHAGLDEVDLLSHDMGDSVGGEVLARSLDGDLPFTIRRRVLSNGSIYIRMAQLTLGQQILSQLPDEKLAADAAIGADGYKGGLSGTFAPDHQVPDEELDAHWDVMSTEDGHLLLPRTIRYLEQRYVHEGRWTGAIESHPSPLTVVWGALDPVAVLPMTEKLLEARPDASLEVLEDVGHYPMVETPDRFTDLALAGLDG
jgi:pimeloyl-ACP methyl ester carboxylesterase